MDWVIINILICRILHGNLNLPIYFTLLPWVTSQSFGTFEFLIVDLNELEFRYSENVKLNFTFSNFLGVVIVSYVLSVHLIISFKPRAVTA